MSFFPSVAASRHTRVEGECQGEGQPEEICIQYKVGDIPVLVVSIHRED